jgi:hypothetical protein
VASGKSGAHSSRIALISSAGRITVSAAMGSIEKNCPNNQIIDAAFSVSLRTLWGYCSVVV